MVVTLRDVKGNLVAGDLLMRKFADEVTGDDSAMFPAALPGEIANDLIKLRPCHVWTAFKPRLCFKEDRLEIVAQSDFCGIVPRTKVRPKSASQASNTGPRSTNMMSSFSIFRSG